MTKGRKAGVAATGGARGRILEAADKLAHEEGPAHLTLDAVAARAGVSKGGLLYHFPSKMHLLTALVDEYLQDFEAEIDKRQRAVPTPGRATLSAYLDASLDECARKDKLESGVLAAMVENPEMLVPIRAFKRRMLDRISSAVEDKAAVLLLFLALDGLRSMKLLDLDILTQDEVEQAVSAMRGLITGAAPEPC